jgi:hypothetical protein
MIDSQDLMEWFRNTFRHSFEDLANVRDWKVLKDAAIFRKHTGDLEGSIEAMVKAVGLMRTVPALRRETATNLNYLADLYLTTNATDDAERTIREAIGLSRHLLPDLLAANLCILAEIQSRSGDHKKAITSAEEARDLFQQEGNSHGASHAEELIKGIRINSE